MTFDQIDRLAREVVERVDSHRKECVGDYTAQCTVLDDVRQLIEDRLQEESK